MKTCPKCGSEAPDNRDRCPKCNRRYSARDNRWKPTECKQCGGEGTFAEKTEAKKEAVGCVFVLIGGAVSLTGLGAIIGIPMLIWGIVKMVEREKLWRCDRCGNTLTRA